MISARLEYKAQATENAAHVMETFTVITGALFKQTFNKVGKEYERELRVEPPRRYWDKTDFVSDAQRRAFFAKTKGQAYQRTGKYRMAWVVSLVQTDGGAAIRASNDRPEAKFVGGTFNRQRDFQQKGHTRTGWNKVRDTSDKYNMAMVADFTARKDKYLNQALGTSTTSTRNR